MDSSVATNFEKSLNLQSKPSSSRSKNERNVVLFGRTGTGKSTFLNALLIYIQYQNEGDIFNIPAPRVLIPTRYTKLDNENKEHEINVESTESHQGQKNEWLDPRKSGTKGCWVYSFHLSGVTINFIDTPGIGDVEGIRKDQGNMENILNVLASFEEIHGICILMRPDEERIDTTFRYCLLGILSQLDMSATKNLMFIFPKIKSTDYKLGESSVKIRTMLDDLKKANPLLKLDFCNENYFLFDNDCFRYLLEKDIPSLERNFGIDKYNLEECWKVSKASAQRMIEKILQNPPYDMKNSMCIHRCRKVIDIITPYLKTIENNITQNEALSLKYEDEVEECEGDLQNLLYIPTIEIKTMHFETPRIVCCSERCRKVIRVHGIERVHYPKVCFKAERTVRETVRDAWSWLQEKCYANSGLILSLLPALITDEVSSSTAIQTALLALLSAAAEFPIASALAGVFGTVAVGGVATWYANQSCTVCGCKVIDHWLTYHETTEVEKSVLNPSVSLETKENEFAKVATKQDLLQGAQTRLQDLKFERNVILEATAIFSAFLKQKSILPFNDGYVAKVEEELAEALQRCDYSGANELEQKISIQEQNKFSGADESTESNETEEVTPDAVNDMIMKLKTLNSCMGVLEDAVSNIDAAKRKNAGFGERTTHIDCNRYSFD